LRPANAGQKLTNFGAAENHRQLSAPAEADEVEYAQRTAEGVLEEELDAEEMDAEGALGAPLKRTSDLPGCGWAGVSRFGRLDLARSWAARTLGWA